MNCLECKDDGPNYNFFFPGTCVLGSKFVTRVNWKVTVVGDEPTTSQMREKGHYHQPHLLPYRNQYP